MFLRNISVVHSGASECSHSTECSDGRVVLACVILCAKAKFCHSFRDLSAGAPVRGSNEKSSSRDVLAPLCVSKLTVSRDSSAHVGASEFGAEL